jgi:2-polyprenyl-3-methyl-5-hydroxy-6-metoxy-1,4-benzoquinol methylase
MPDPPATPSARFAWQTCLDIEGQSAGHYPDHVNLALLGGVGSAPRRVLELGCASGGFGAELRAKFPGTVVVGVEANHAAAAIAATRIDRVIVGRLETLDLALEGFAPGDFDLVIAADVIEHVANPWDLLVRIKPFLAPDAIVLASIPNVRNILLVEALLCRGRWDYAERGLLDITHLRFFTLAGIRDLFAQTGYRMEGHAITVEPSLVELYRSARGQPLITVEMGRLKLDQVTPAELDELCAVQFLVKARPE